MKVIVHANNWSLTLAFHIIFTRAQVNFTWAQARVCLGVATPLIKSTIYPVHACAKGLSNRFCTSVSSSVCLFVSLSGEEFEYRQC